MHRIKQARREAFITMVTQNPYFLAACRLQDVALFQEGLPAIDAIKLMAEDGDNSALLVRSRVKLFVLMLCLDNVYSGITVVRVTALQVVDSSVVFRLASRRLCYNTKAYL